GQPMEHVIRMTLIALRMSERLRLGEPDRVVVYYSGLMAWVGCHTDAYEQAKWFGDDIIFKADWRLVDNPGLDFVIQHVGAGKRALERDRLREALLKSSPERDGVSLRNHWVAIDSLAHRLELGDDVRQSLKESFERWDGNGAFGIKGDELRLTSRLLHLAD